MTRDGSGLDTGIAFLARFVEAEGGLAELRADSALLVVPDHLRTTLDAAEELVVTEDPEVAREDGCILVAPGHPQLMSAAGAVLAHGDVGCARIARGGDPPPRLSAIEAKVRDQVPAEHGRLAVATAPDAMDLLAVRAAALVTYRISLDEHVQEVEEVWLEPETLSELHGDLLNVVRSAAILPDTTPGIHKPSEELLGAADSLIASRAQRRAGMLARSTAARLGQQLRVVDDYYEHVLASLDERRSRAPVPRAKLLDGQAEATRAEWERRRAEVAQDLTPSVEVRPFRLHVVAVPAYRVRASVQRGTREYPLSLVFVPQTGSFLAPLCPSCGARATLVAAKDRLGCRSCLADTRRTPEPPAPAVIEAPALPAAGEPADQPPARQVEDGEPADKPPARHPPGGRAPSRSGRFTPKGTRPGSPHGKAGARIASRFWSSAWSGTLERHMKIAGGSPLDALARLYGDRGPAMVVGLAEDERPESVETSTWAVEEGGTELTTGVVHSSSGRPVHFALYWKRGTSELLEVEAFDVASSGRYLTGRGWVSEAYRRRLARFLGPPPAPLEELDTAPAALLERSARVLGLSFAARCLAVWWYLTEDAPAGEGVQLGPDDPAAAAAVESVVRKRAGIPGSAAALAATYGCSPEDVRRHSRRIHAELRGAGGLRW